MISTEHTITKVRFGNDKKANIAVTAKAGVLTLQMLAKEKQIGDSLDSEDVQEIPRVEIEFFTIKSIDILIGALESIKKNYVPHVPLRNPPNDESSSGQLSEAC